MVVQYNSNNIFDDYSFWAGEINDGNNTRARGRIKNYYKVFALPMKQSSLIWKWTWNTYKHTLQTKQPLIRVIKGIIDISRKEKKLNHKIVD